MRVFQVDNILVVVKRCCSLFLILLLLSVISLKPVHANFMAPDAIQKMSVQVLYITLSVTAIAAIFNGLIEALTLYILGLKEKRIAITVVVVNFITWPVFFYIFYSTDIQLLTIIFLEFIVVVFETLVIYLFNRKLEILKLFLKVGIANIISAIVGTLIVYGLVIAWFTFT
jgi:hypothetical protein